jgi:hypothetical protein
VGIWAEGKQEFKFGTGSTAMAHPTVNDVYVDENGKIFAANKGGLSISRDGGTTWTTPLKSAPGSRGFLAVAGFQNKIFAGGVSPLSLLERTLERPGPIVISEETQPILSLTISMSMPLTSGFPLNRVWRFPLIRGAAGSRP